MATYYAGVGGNDANSGLSWALRKLTIQAAVNVATTAGDSVLVGPGVYRETVTMGTSGTAGNIISLIGDYTGANTSGVKGVVRITGSADDIALTRTNCIVASGRSYIAITGFSLDLSSGNLIALATSPNHVTISKCDFVIAAATIGFDVTGTSQAAVTFQQCQFAVGAAGGCLRFFPGSAVDNAGHLIENCIFRASHNSYSIQSQKVGGITVRNTIIMGGLNGVQVSSALTVGQTVTVNNCIIANNSVALSGTTTGEITEDYNTLFGNATARTNTATGTNSVARPPLFDTRWFFEMVNGGRLITPFDLASYSTLVELNSGTGAPSTDLRGASQVGSYREWGALEYDANYRTHGPVSIAPIGGIG